MVRQTRPAARPPRGCGRARPPEPSRRSRSGGFASPTRSSTRRCMRGSGRRAGPGCTIEWRRPWRSSAGADPGDHLGELALHWRLAAVAVDRAKAADYALERGSARSRVWRPRRRRSCSPSGRADRRRGRLRAVRGADRARRGAAPDRRSSPPRDAARGVAHRCGVWTTPSSPPRQHWQTTEGSVASSVRSTTNGWLRSSGRSSSMTRQTRLAVRGCSRSRRLNSHLTSTSSGVGRSPRRRSRWRASRGRRGRSPRSSGSRVNRCACQRRSS